MARVSGTELCLQRHPVDAILVSMKASSKPSYRADVYQHRDGCVVLIKYHLIWIPRRRRRVLVGAVADRLEVLLHEKASELGITIERLAIASDHLHLFIDAPPTLAPSQIAYRLKGYTSRILRQEFKQLLKMPSMWTTSYFCSTAQEYSPGAVSQEVIKRYIEAQSTRA